MRIYRTNNCIDCGTPIYRKSTRCRPCADRSKIKTPPTPALCACGCGYPVGIGRSGRRPRFITDHASSTRKRDSPNPRLYTINSETGCWEWNGCLSSDGYGSGRIDGKSVRLHRWSYSYHVGPIPDGHEIHHTCRNRRCFNPDHLVAITRTAHRQLPDRSKLSWESVRRIRLMYPGRSQQSIADEFGITQPIVSAVLLNKIWKE